jgi:hypothetical protein
VNAAVVRKAGRKKDGLTHHCRNVGSMIEGNTLRKPGYSALRNGLDLAEHANYSSAPTLPFRCPYNVGLEIETRKGVVLPEERRPAGQTLVVGLQHVVAVGVLYQSAQTPTP